MMPSVVRNLWCYLILVVTILSATNIVCAFSVSSSSSTTGNSNIKNTIRVKQVKSLADWYALADIRYNEWIQDESDTTPRNSFRQATVEIYQEERPDSILFLAKQGGGVVGAAEMSPLELQDALTTTTGHCDNNNIIMYVTDVVTDQKYRRQGIAATLMHVLESYAIQLGIDHLVLNVAPDNYAALKFYQTLGYEEQLSPKLLKILNVEQVAENAGTQGQLLLSKTMISTCSETG